VLGRFEKVITAENKKIPIVSTNAIQNSWR
jgi:hypothetical protein